MKNASKRSIFIALVAVIGLSFAAPVQASGIVDRVFNAGAKSLAKQAANVTKQAAELQERSAALEERVLALPDSDRRAFIEENALLVSNLDV